MLSFKKIFIFFLFQFSFFTSKSQVNLVPNGGFEQYSTCPNSVDQVGKSVGWISMSQSPDYFNACSTGTDVSVPYNLFGQQYAASGNSYMGFYTFSSAVPNTREIIGAQLTNSLIVGQKYYIKFKLNLTLDYTSNTATDKAGVRFSTVQHNSVSALPPINNFAHVYVTNTITDTVNWTTVFKSFVSDSNYKFIEIGNFFNDANTTKSVQWSQATDRSYYYFDELCVSTDSLFTLNYTTSIVQLDFQKRIFFYPNPCLNGNLYFNNELNADVTIYDSQGKKLRFFKIENENYLEMNLPEGFYIIKIENKEINITEKIIIKN